MKTLIILFALLLLPGCVGGHFEDGYQFGDITRTAKDAIETIEVYQSAYCNGVSDERRAKARDFFENEIGLDFDNTDVCAITAKVILDRAKSKLKGDVPVTPE